MTIVEFLLARIAEDEKVASDGSNDLFGPVYVEGYGDLTLIEGGRLRAECQAKRAIVERAASPVAHAGQDIERRAILKDLAAVYADHPDYRLEWRP